MDNQTEKMCFQENLVWPGNWVYILHGPAKHFWDYEIYMKVDIRPKCTTIGTYPNNVFFFLLYVIMCFTTISLNCSDIKIVCLIIQNEAKVNVKGGNYLIDKMHSMSFTTIYNRHDCFTILFCNWHVTAIYSKSCIAVRSWYVTTKA